jgi:RNA polymerase sigma factor (sigma-70 family)
LTQLADISPVLTETPERADEDAATLYDCYGPRIREYCYGQLRDRLEADDAVQSTFLYAFTLLRRGETPRKPLPWLYTIAHNVCRTRRRALKRRSRVESSVDLADVQETIGRNDPPHEDLVNLATSLAALPLSQRTALLLREWQGLSYSEIAVELGLTESAVEAVLFRARRNLARKLQYVSDRAATIAGAALLLPSLRRLSPFGPAARTATATAVLVGTAALVPFADTPRATRAAEPAVTRSSPPQPSESPNVPLRTEAPAEPKIATSAHVAPLDAVTVQIGTQAAASFPPPQPDAVPVPTPGGGSVAPAPAPAPVSVAVPTTPSAPDAPPVAAPAAAPEPPQAVTGAGQTVVDTTTDVVATVQATAGTVENTAGNAVDTVTSTVSTVANQATSTLQQLPTVPSSLESPPQNTPLPGLP